MHAGADAAGTMKVGTEVGGMNESQITDLLERLGRAVSSVDVREIARLWETPAMVLGDQGAIAIADRAEIERHFTEAAKWYHERGLFSTRPEVERIDLLTDTLAAVDVRWPSYDAAGQEKASERSHYIVAAGSDGQPHVRVALTRTR
jgi:hypothetical protein